VERGFDPEHFWSLTPRECFLRIEAADRRLDSEHNQAAWLAWHTAFFTAYAPVKSTDFVKLDTLLRGQKLSKGGQTPDEQIAIAMAWTARTGGTTS
jgi:hypothetical protein